MAKKLSYDQIADEKDILKPLTDSVEKVVDALQQMEKEFKTNIELANDIAQTKAFKNVKDINNVEEAIKKVAKESENLDRIEKQRLKLEERLKDLNDERIKDNIRIQEQIKIETKELRRQAKEQTQVLNAYEKLTKATNEAQKEFKALAAQYGENSKEAKRAQGRFNDLNDQLEKINKSAKDGRRNVGRYADGIEDAGKRIGKAAVVITVVLEALSKLRDIVSSNTEAASSFEKIFGALTITLQVFVNRAVKAFPALLDLFISFFNDTKKAASDWATSIQVSFLESVNVAGLLDDQISDLRKNLNDSDDNFNNTANAASRIADAFKGTGDEIVDLVKKNNALIDLTIKYRKEILALEKENAKLIGTQAELEAKASDATSSIQEQIDANNKLLEINDEIAANTLEIAQKEFDLATKRAEINSANLEAQEAAAAAFVALEQTRAEAQTQRFETLKEISQLEQDLIEQQLDILFDDADTRKTINEQIIADETKTFETRKKALEENNRLAEETFNAQTKLVNDNLAEQGKAIIDFTELSRVESEKEITERLKNAGLSEILTTRALELLRERRLFLQDNAVAQQEFNDAEKEANEIRKDIISQEEALAELQKAGVDSSKVLAALEDQRLTNDIENLRLKLALVKEGSAEELKLEQELNDKLLEQNQKRIEKEQEQQEKAQAERERLAESGLAALESLSQKRTEKQIEELDKLIAKEEERASELKQLAAEGNQEAQRNLASQQQRQAQLAQQREAAIRREKKEAAGLAILEAFNALLAQGETPQAATIKSVTSVTALQSIIESLPIFHEGTKKSVAEDLKNGKGYIGNNEYLSVLQGGEKVFNEEHSAMIPKNMSNYEVALAAKSYDKPNVIAINDARLYNELKNTRLAIENKPTLTDVRWNEHLEAFESYIEQKGRFEKRRVKRKSISSKL